MCGTERNTVFVISFDESLDNEFHKEQMDFFVKYVNKEKVVCRYISLRFIGHTCAEDLKKEFEEGIQELDMKKIVEERNQNDDYPALIDIGSCSLHVVHGAFRSSVQKAKWGLDGVLIPMHNLFDESPAKRDYQDITGSKVFPQPFSGHRLIEDKKVADRALDLVQNC